MAKPRIEYNRLDMSGPSGNWNEIAHLFDQLTMLSKSDREEQLKVIKASNHDTYTQIKSLLEADDNPNPIFGNPAKVVLEEWNKDPGLIGEHIGAFRLENLIGQGAMGSVFKAVRIDGQFEQTVAIKLMNSHMLNSSHREFFQRERQILAKLNHPGIARLYDGGFIKDGRPFFTMEWVSGSSLVAYCKSNKSTLKERIGLFIKVCEAVRYAHQSLIVHLDLKPQNILIDKSGSVKLLDFGVSKLVEDHQIIDNSPFTLAYASPEQLSKNDLNTASDIYSLGVILAELIIGKHPFSSYLQNPLKLKEAILTGDRSGFSFQKNITTPFFDDLKTICLKATQINISDRYSTVDQLINDLQAFLTDYPISTRKESIKYRARKYFKRNKPMLISISIAVLMLVGMATYYTSMLSMQRDIAKDEAKKANQITALLTDVFMAADPNIGGADTITAVTLLDQGLEKLSKNLDEDQELYADMLLRLAPIYFNLGQYEKGKKITFEGYELYKSNPDISAEYLALAEKLVSNSYFYFGDLDSAKLAIETAIDRLEKDGIVNGETYAEILIQLGNVSNDLGDLQTADSVYHLAYSQYLELREAPDLDIAFCLHMLGSVARDLGDLDQGEKYLLEAMAMKQDLFESPHLELAYTQNYLGSLYQAKREYEKALEYIRKSFDQRKQILGIYHVETLASMANTARTFNLIGRYDEAIALYDTTLLIVDSLFSKNHYYYAGLIGSQGNSYYELGDYEKAKENIEQSRIVLEKLNPSNLLTQASPLSRLGDIAKKQQNLNLAKEYYLQALKFREDALPAGHFQITQSQQALGECLLDLGDYPTAIEYLELALEAYQTSSEDRTKEIIALHTFLLQAYQATQNFEKAEYYETLMASKEE